MKSVDPGGLVTWLGAWVFLGLAIVITRELRSRITLTPIVVFFSVWTILSGLYVLDVAVKSFTAPISMQATALYLVSFAAFFVGATTPMLAAGRQPLKSNEEGLTEVQLARLRLVTRTELCIVGLLVAYKGWVLVHRYDDLRMLLYLARREFVGGGLAFPWFTAPVTPLMNLAVASLGLLAAYSWRRMWLDGIVALLLAVINDATIADKAGLRLVVLFVFALGLTKLTRGTLVGRWRELMAILSVCFLSVMAFSLITWFRITEVGREELDFISLNLEHLYLNIVGNIVSFSYFVQYPMSELTPGAWTFSGLYRAGDWVAQWLGGDLQWAVAASQEDPTTYADIVVGVYNTSNHLAFYYSDFGVGGVAILSWAFGVFASVTEVRATRTRRVGAKLCLALWLVAIVSSVRGVYFGAMGFWLTLLAVPIQAWVGLGRNARL